MKGNYVDNQPWPILLSESTDLNCHITTSQETHTNSWWRALFKLQYVHQILIFFRMRSCWTTKSYILRYFELDLKVGENPTERTNQINCFDIKLRPSTWLHGKKCSNETTKAVKKTTARKQTWTDTTQNLKYFLKVALLMFYEEENALIHLLDLKDTHNAWWWEKLNVNITVWKFSCFPHGHNSSTECKRLLV